MKGRKKQRDQRRTILLVGEGDSEEYFLRHLKVLYVQRGGGVAVTIRNARGKGAAHVVDMAIRHSKNAAFDMRAVLLDTDTDWNQTTRAMARKGHVVVLPAEPCLEALLLAMHGHSVQDRSIAQLKHDFAVQFGSAASQAEVFERHFTRDLVQEARTRLTVLNELLVLLETGIL